MAIDKQKFIDDQIEIHKKRKRIQKLSDDRRAEEQALAVEYKVDELNFKRAQIQNTYDGLIRTLQNDINSIIESQGEVV